MPSAHTAERDFESDVEQYLEDAGWRTFRKERAAGAGFAAGQEDYDRALALKTDTLVSFVKETQPMEWAKIEGLFGPRAEAEFLKRVCDKLEPHENRDGLINTLRGTVKMAPNASFKLCFFKPVSDKNPDTAKLWQANRFEVVRQLRYGTLKGVDENDSIDIVLFLNGIPIVTMELKNNLTGQRTDHAVAQYKRDRDPRELIFKPNRRSIVHFAFDSETAEMTTWLSGEDTFFMPFNKGNGRAGGGNPPNPNGYRTEYLYHEILSPSSLMDIIQRYVRVEYDPDTFAMKKVIFPRYHQLDAVRELTAQVLIDGPGKNYLIQHSAGSGKSNTISWLAHRLTSLHDVSGNAMFDTVVVLTDRRNLDSQLSSTVESVDHKTGVVRCITESDGSAGLRDALNAGAKIVTSTIQKFPYICSEVKSAGKRYAVIIDEAHSSQTGKSHAKMKLALSGQELDEDLDNEERDLIAEELQAQGQLPNLSCFAFTATPKQVTLEVFGTRDELCCKDKAGRLIPRAFHLYSMKQAIDEGFILDVLESYTCYQQYYKLAKTIKDDPKYKGSKANPALLAVAVNDPNTVAQKAAIIVEHFMNDVASGLNGIAKAMVVTRSRRAAYELWSAINAYIKEHDYSLKTMVAFSGKLQVGEKEVTETSLNGVNESNTPKEFDKDDERVIVCADKYQTGFDQPKLCAMYVDKMLTGVTAVQTLSRLNRCYPHKFTRVVDFVNDWDTVEASFSSYYEATELDAVTDPNVVYDIKERLDGFHIYDETDIKAVSDAWYETQDMDETLRKIESRLAPSVDRWTALEESNRKLFKALLKKFLRNYNFITQMISLGDEGLHRFFCYAGVLIKKLYIETDGVADVKDKVELEYLRIENKGTQSIKLESEKLHNGAANAGVKRDEEKEFLSELVKHMNDAFGTDWKDADKVFRACTDKLLEDKRFVNQCRHNSLDDIRAIFGDALMDALASIMAESAEITDAIESNESGYMKFLSDNLLPYIFKKINQK